MECFAEFGSVEGGSSGVEETDFQGHSGPFGQSKAGILKQNRAIFGPNPWERVNPINQKLLTLPLRNSLRPKTARQNQKDVSIRGINLQEIALALKFQIRKRYSSERSVVI